MSAKELKADVGIIGRFGPSATSLGPVYDQNSISVMEFGFEMVCDQVRAISQLYCSVKTLLSLLTVSFDP